MTKDRYSGNQATPYDMIRPADFYRHAAGSILIGDPISAGPMRLLAIRSIEFDLSTYLLLKGSSLVTIRRMGHVLAERLEHAKGTSRGMPERMAGFGPIGVGWSDRDKARFCQTV